MKKVNVFRQFFIVLFVFIFNFSFTQNDSITKESNKKFKLNPWDNVNGFKVAPSYYKNFEFEVGYFISSYPALDPGYGGFFQLVQNVGLSLEYVNYNQYNIVGTKLYYELNYSIFSAQLGGGVLFSDQGHQYRITPKIGLSLFSFGNLYFGWNNNLLSKSRIQPPKYTITLSVNLYDNF